MQKPGVNQAVKEGQGKEHKEKLLLGKLLNFLRILLICDH